MECDKTVNCALFKCKLISADRHWHCFDTDAIVSQVSFKKSSKVTTHLTPWNYFRYRKRANLDNYE